MISNEITAKINIGAEICYKIKQIYFQQEPWSMDLAKKVSKKYNSFKEITRKWHLDLKEEQFLKKIREYTKEQIKDCFELYTETKDEVHNDKMEKF